HAASHGAIPSNSVPPGFGRRTLTNLSTHRRHIPRGASWAHLSLFRGDRMNNSTDAHIFPIEPNQLAPINVHYMFQSAHSQYCYLTPRRSLDFGGPGRRWL